MAQDSTYQNPVDGKAYTADWKTYKPQHGEALPENPKVQVAGVRLLNRQDEFAQYTSVDDLVAYLKQVNHIASTVFADSGIKAEVMAQFESSPGKTALKLASQGGVPDKLMQAFYEQVNALPPLRVSSSILQYQVEYHITP